jgi:hypothetical protein
MQDAERAALMAELREEIAQLGELLVDIGKLLGAYYARRASLQDEVARTHHYTEDTDSGRAYVTRYKRADRGGLFAELDRLNEAHAPEKNEQRKAIALRKALMKKLELLQKAKAA